MSPKGNVTSKDVKTEREVGGVAGGAGRGKGGGGGGGEGGGEGESVLDRRDVRTRSHAWP